MNFSSKTIEQAVESLSVFPGVGKRSALRMVLYLINRPSDEVKNLAQNLINLKENLTQCKICCNISDTEICAICNTKNRNQQVICLVEDFQDVMAIESTNQFFGLYHVLGGLISPMDGIGPDSLTINNLIQRIENSEISEVIIALNANIEGDTTAFYIARKLQVFTHIKISTISKGIAVGGELEYADEITLGRSILNRVPLEL